MVTCPLPELLSGQSSLQGRAKTSRDALARASDAKPSPLAFTMGTSVPVRQSFRPLAPRRAISCGQGIIGGHELSKQTKGDISIDYDNDDDEAFLSAEQAGQHPEDDGPPASPLPPSAAAAAMSALHGASQSKMKPSTALHVAAAMFGAYASESGAAALVPPDASPCCRDPEVGPGPIHTGFLSAPPVGPPVLPAGPAAELHRVAAAALVPHEPPTGGLGLPEAEIQELLRPCGNPCLPLEAGWAQRDARPRPACDPLDISGAGLPDDCTIGAGGIGSLPSFLSDDLCSADDARAYPAAGVVAPVDPMDADLPGDGCGEGQDPASGAPAGNRHRACEFGYTCSAPVHAAAAARRGAAYGMVPPDPGMQEARLMAVCGALSAPANHQAGAAKRDGGACSGKGVQPPPAPLGASAWPLLVDTPETQLPRSAADGLCGSGQGAIAADTGRLVRVGGRGPASGRRAASARRATRHVLLDSTVAAAAAAVAAGWVPASSSDNDSLGQRVRWTGSKVSDTQDRRSLGGSTYFGTALAVGLSTLLDTIASDAAGKSMSHTHKPSGLGLAPGTVESLVGRARGRGRARLLGHRIFSCFIGGAGGPSPSAAATRFD